jgi:hypothetical protein
MEFSEEREFLVEAAEFDARFIHSTRAASLRWNKNTAGELVRRRFYLHLHTPRLIFQFWYFFFSFS